MTKHAAKPLFEGLAMFEEEPVRKQDALASSRGLVKFDPSFFSEIRAHVRESVDQVLDDIGVIKEVQSEALRFDSRPDLLIQIEALRHTQRTCHLNLPA